jgi:hypothetical protein
VPLENAKQSIRDLRENHFTHEIEEKKCQERKEKTNFYPTYYSGEGKALPFL